MEGSGKTKKGQKTENVITEEYILHRMLGSGFVIVHSVLVSHANKGTVNLFDDWKVV